VSEQQPRVSLDEIEAPVCDTCGGPIEEPDQDCPALDDEVCAP
jgi:hypothetical protein